MSQYCCKETKQRFKLIKYTWIALSNMKAGTSNPTEVSFICFLLWFDHWYVTAITFMNLGIITFSISCSEWRIPSI